VVSLSSHGNGWAWPPFDKLRTRVEFVTRDPPAQRELARVESRQTGEWPV
jgi:hypothetical protein